MLFWSLLKRENAHDRGPVGREPDFCDIMSGHCHQMWVIVLCLLHYFEAVIFNPSQNHFLILHLKSWRSNCCIMLIRMIKAIKHQLSDVLSTCVVFNVTRPCLETWGLAHVQTWSVLSTFMYTCHWNCLECDTKAIGWKVSQHLVPAAVLGRALLSSLPSDSQEPCSLTWVVLTFTALFKASHIPPFCFLWKDRKSCLQLFPALWTKEVLQAHTHLNTQFTVRVSTHPPPLSFFLAWVQDAPLWYKDDPRDDGMKPKAFRLSFASLRCTQDSRAQTCSWKANATNSEIKYKTFMWF